MDLVLRPFVGLVAVALLVRQARRTAARERLARLGVGALARRSIVGRARRRPVGAELGPELGVTVESVRGRRARGTALGPELGVAVESVRGRRGRGAGLGRELGVTVESVRGRRVRGAALGRELPVAVELVRMGVGAGLTPADALAVVAGSGLGPSRGLAVRVGQDVAAGLTFREAGRRRADDLGDPDVARLLDLLGDGQRSGAPLGHALGVLAADLRAGQRRRAEERARAVPVKLLFPLVFLALPAFVLLTVAPAVLVAFER
jgi:tight adherence protein C